MLKAGLLLLDIVISIVAVVWIWDLTHSNGVVAIALGLSLWSFFYGRFRARR